MNEMLEMKEFGAQAEFAITGVNGLKIYVLCLNQDPYHNKTDPHNAIR